MTMALTVGGIVLYLILMFAIGFAAFRKNKAGDADDWFVVGRKANLFMLVGMLCATWFSTCAFLGGLGTFYLKVRKSGRSGRGRSWRVAECVSDRHAPYITKGPRLD